MILTPEGKVARYFLGLRDPTTRPSRAISAWDLVEASEHKIGTPVVDRVLAVLLPLRPGNGQIHHDGDESGASGGALTVVVLASLLLVGMAARGGKQARGAGDGHGEARRRASD